MWTFNSPVYRTFTFAIASMSLEEATGLIQGLADVVKNQQQLQNTAIQKTTGQLQTLSDTVANLAQNLPSASPSIIQPNGLHLPNLILPIYTGREHLDRFITLLESILKSSNVPSQYWLTYLLTWNSRHNKITAPTMQFVTLRLPILWQFGTRCQQNISSRIHETVPDLCHRPQNETRKTAGPATPRLAGRVLHHATTTKWKCSRFCSQIHRNPTGSGSCSLKYCN